MTRRFPSIRPRLSRIGIALAAVAALGLAGAALSIASIPDSGGVIHGCYVKSTGVLKVIDTAKTTACATGSVGLNWSQTGPQGPAGPQGPIGPQGSAANVSFVKTSYTYTAAAYSYAEVTVTCPSGDAVTGGGVGDTLYYGSSGAVLETFPTTVDGLAAWQVDVSNSYSQPEPFTVYAICAQNGGATNAVVAHVQTHGLLPRSRVIAHSAPIPGRRS